MAVKFSAFTTRTGTLDASTKIVGYDDPAGTKTNVEFSLATLAANSGIYAADGTIGTTRKALITDTIQFRDAGDTSDVFSLNTNGTFTLGKGAAAGGGYTAIAIGNAAAAASNYSISIGSSSDTSATYAIAIGSGATGAQATGQDSIAIGGNGAAAVGASSTAIGYSAITGGDYSINIGRKSRGSADNAITLNASTDAVAAPSTANAFGVYMSSNTTPDFAVHHDGNSYITGSGKFGIGKSNPLATLDIVHYDATRKLVSFNNASATEVFSIEDNGTVKITGQAYTELNDIGTVATATWDIDWNNSNIQSITLNNGGAMTLNTPTNPKTGATYILKLIQGASPSTITWTASIFKWPAAAAPVLSTSAGQVDIVTLIYDGTNYYGTSTINLS